MLVPPQKRKNQVWLFCLGAWYLNQWRFEQPHTQIEPGTHLFSMHDIFFYYISLKYLAVQL